MPSEDSDQDTITQQVHPSKVENPKNSKNKYLVWALTIIFVLFLGFCGYKIYIVAFRKGIRSESSAECTKLAKVVIANSWPVKYISCEEQSLAKITNASLTGKYVTFTAGDKINSCAQHLASIDPGSYLPSVTPKLDSDSCSQWSGAVLSNGQYFYGVGRPASDPSSQVVTFANVNDTCMSLQYGSKNGGGYSKRSLYMYEDKLYDRYDYTNLVLKIALGSCTFNGTVLVGSSTSVTNIQITINTPRDCFDAYSGKNYDNTVQLNTCLDMAASAFEDPSICHVTKRLGVKPYAGSGPTVVYPLDGSGGTWNLPYTDNECLDSYTSHMAWLNKCAVINDTATRAKCDTKYNQIRPYLKIVTVSI